MVNFLNATPLHSRRFQGGVNNFYTPPILFHEFFNDGGGIFLQVFF